MEESLLENWYTFLVFLFSCSTAGHEGGKMNTPKDPIYNVPGQTYLFADFTLDLSRGCLLHKGQEIKLRRKSFEVLKYLVERHGRLIGKEELIGAVWPDSFVTDDSLTHCLMEVRQALGGASQEILKTVPRRGY